MGVSLLRQYFSSQTGCSGWRWGAALSSAGWSAMMPPNRRCNSRRTGLCARRTTYSLRGHGLRNTPESHLRPDAIRDMTREARTALSSIEGFAELLAEDLADSEHLLADLRKITEA